MSHAVTIGRGHAHAKTILLGEHAVVYGHPAIAFPVPALTLSAAARVLPCPGDPALSLDVPSSESGHRRGKRRVATVGEPSTGAIYVDFGTEAGEDELAQSALRVVLEFLGEEPGRTEVTVEGSIPTARGLGSSAAMASAIALAVARLYGREITPAERFELVQRVETIAHGTPSGLDAHTTMADGPVWFRSGEATPLDLPARPALLVADTGLPGRTLRAVADVRRMREERPREAGTALERLEALTHEARAGLALGDMTSVGAAMTEGHDVLSTLGVSHPALDHLVQSAQNAGALGAKLTGGGQGGCIIALAQSAAGAPRVATALRSAGAAHVWHL